MYFSLNTSYILVNIRVRIRGESYSETVLFWRIDDLKETVYAAEKHEFQILQVGLISPPFMNGTKGWKISNLKQIWSAQKNSSSNAITIYVADDGEIFSDDFENKNFSSFELRKLIFELKPEAN